MPRNPDDVSRALDLDRGTPVVLCDARDRASRKEVLIRMVEDAGRMRTARLLDSVGHAADPARAAGPGMVIRTQAGLRKPVFRSGWTVARSNASGVGRRLPAGEPYARLARDAGNE